MNNPLLDTEFLLKLFSQHLQEKFVKIISLDLDENPQEEIQGKVTSGSINVDGSSAVHRTCSLTLVANEINIHFYYWGLNTKFKVSIGLTNNIDKNYEDIIWFPQGVFLITSFNTKQNINSWQISISGKDKMCLLNGDIGGTITSLTHDFGKIDRVQRDGTITTDDYLIKDIIREGVHTFGNEPYHNIIINDLDEAALELLENRADVPLYIISYADDEDGNAANCTFDGEIEYYIKVDNSFQKKKLKSLANDKTFITYSRLDNIDLVDRPTHIYAENNNKAIPYILTVINFGETAGYRPTNLTYAGDLIGSIGASFTSACLDNIVKMLGEYEYFYNLDGQFVFQRKRNFINSSWNNMVVNEDETYYDSAAYSSACSWFFENPELLISVQNTPNYQNLKNDFVVWGKKNETTPIHMRYAIDKKPMYYKTLNGGIYYSEQFNELDLLVNLNILTKDQIQERINNFTLTYDDAAMIGFEKPIRKEDGSWTPGWWDIRDWYEYYSLILREKPNKTMKWYSYNDTVKGCVSLDTLYSQIEENGYKISSGSYYLDKGNSVWLIIVNHSTKSVNVQHGCGIANPDVQRNCICYISEEQPDGSIVTTSTGERKYFIAPYSGCSDDHTFLKFLKDDVKENVSVYFYNPNFYIAEKADDYDELITDEVKKELNEYIANNCHKVDWREIIYQMAKDYYSCGVIGEQGNQKYLDSFLALVGENNKDYYPSGYTGYEQYYTDIYSFWRQIYNPFEDYEYIQTYVTESKYNGNNYYWFESCENKSWVAGEEYFYFNLSTLSYTKVPELSINETEAYRLSPQDYFILKCNRVPKPDGTYENVQDRMWSSDIIYYKRETGKFMSSVEKNENGIIIKDYSKCWHKNVYNSPENLIFWFDFLDGDYDVYNNNTEQLASDLAAYGVNRINDRPKTVNNDKLKSMYFIKTPTIMFYEKESELYDLVPTLGKFLEQGRSYFYYNDDLDDYVDITTLPEGNIKDDETYYLQVDKRKTGYKYLKLTKDLLQYFTLSAQGASVKDELDNLLYQHTYCTEQVSITCLPVYHLQPNTRIFIKDKNSGINGEYLIKSFTVPLSYNGTMTITATKAAERIY